MARSGCIANWDPGSWSPSIRAASSTSCPRLVSRSTPQVLLPVRYRGITIDNGYWLDLLVGDKVVVEVKAVEKLEPVHEAQLLTYLKLSGCCVGLLLNFNVELLRDGIRRLVLGFPDLCETSASSAPRR